MGQILGMGVVNWKILSWPISNRTETENSGKDGGVTKNRNLKTNRILQST